MERMRKHDAMALLTFTGIVFALLGFYLVSIWWNGGFLLNLNWWWNGGFFSRVVLALIYSACLCVPWPQVLYFRPGDSSIIGGSITATKKQAFLCLLAAPILIVIFVGAWSFALTIEPQAPPPPGYRTVGDKPISGDIVVYKDSEGRTIDTVPVTILGLPPEWVSYFMIALTVITIGGAYMCIAWAFESLVLNNMLFFFIIFLAALIASITYLMYTSSKYWLFLLFHLAYIVIASLGRTEDFV